MTDFAKVAYPCQYPAARKKLNKVLGIAEEADQSNLQAEIGEAGTAQSLVMLVKTLEDAKPGDKILVVSFGSGCDALYFEVTETVLQDLWPIRRSWITIQSTWSGAIPCLQKWVCVVKRISGPAGHLSGVPGNL